MKKGNQMKKNKVVLPLAILLVLFSLEMLGTETNYVAASSSTSVSITPESSRTLLYSNFDINLCISDVADLYLWAVTIEWNSTILNLLDYSQGPFLQQGGTTTFLVGKIAAGKIEGLTCSLLGSVQGVSGSGTLATLQFNATATGTTSINITFSDLLDSEGSSITHDVGNATVKVLPRTLPYVFGRTVTYRASTNDSDPSPPRTVPFSDRYNITFSLPDANGVINLTIARESYYFEPAYVPESNFTWQVTMISDGYGKLYTQPNGDVDIISMTNDSGRFFWKDGAWHPPEEEWVGDGTPDPAGSSWVHVFINISHWLGEGTGGVFIGNRSGEAWLTTGFSENTVVEPASRINGFYVNVTGVPFSGLGGVVTYVSAAAKLNDPWPLGPLDVQSKVERCGAPPPAFIAALFSPANLYVTDPENRHIGTHPTTEEYVNEIPGAFYSGPGSEPQRIVIPDPLDGVYDIRIIGTSTGTYTFVAELATATETTVQTYTGNITPGETLISEANISEGKMTSTPPSPPPHPPTPVGGIYIPVNKLELLAPYIGLTILLAVAVVTVIYVKNRKRKSEINF